MCFVVIPWLFASLLHSYFNASTNSLRHLFSLKHFCFNWHYRYQKWFALFAKNKKNIIVKFKTPLIRRNSLSNRGYKDLSKEYCINSQFKTKFLSWWYEQFLLKTCECWSCKLLLLVKSSIRFTEDISINLFTQINCKSS